MYSQHWGGKDRSLGLAGQQKEQIERDIDSKAKPPEEVHPKHVHATHAILYKHVHIDAQMKERGGKERRDGKEEEDGKEGVGEERGGD